MEWPNINPYTGDYITATTEKAVYKRALDAAIADITQDPVVRDAIAPRIHKLKHKIDFECSSHHQWCTKDYRAVVEEFVSIMASASPEQALDMAQAGLDSLHDMMLFRIDHSTIVPAKDIFVLSSSFEKLGTEVILGGVTAEIQQQQRLQRQQEQKEQENDTDDKQSTSTSTRGPLDDFHVGLIAPQDTTKTLYKFDACEQVDAWFKYGIMETSASVLAKSTLASSSVPITLTCNKVYCLLGVTSELGPAKSILQIPGVTVLGIARPGSMRLKELRSYVRVNCPSTSKLLVPEGGADLLSQGPQIAQWVLDQTHKIEAERGGKVELLVFPLAHENGETSVRIAVAMDLVIQRILRQRQASIGSNTSTTMLCQYLSPATVMVVPPTAATNAQQRLECRPSWEHWASTVSMGRWLQPSVPVTASNYHNNNDYTIVNGIMTAQGSQYCLARIMQSWRCMVAYYRDNHVVAAPYCPLTRTRAMTTNEKVAAALEGMHHFEPMLAMDVGPASTLMAAIILSQVQLLNRPLPDMDASPFTIFWDGGAVHSGIWNCPYSLESLTTVTWLLGKTYYPKGYVPDMALPPSARASALTGEGHGGGGDEEEGQEKKSDPENDMFSGSEYGKPMPDCVRERLEFM